MASESTRGTGGDVCGGPLYERGSHVPGVKRPGPSSGGTGRWGTRSAASEVKACFHFWGSRMQPWPLRCGVNVSRVSADFSIIGQRFRRCSMANESTHPEDHNPDQTSPESAVGHGAEDHGG